MNTEIVVAALASGGIGAIVVAIINGFFSKRKFGAEAAEIITRAAAGVVESLEGQLNAQRQLLEVKEQAFENERNRWRMEREENQRAWERHIQWDREVIDLVQKQAGIELPAAPTPPRFAR